MKKITMLATILLAQPVLASHNTEAIRAQEIPVARVADTAKVAPVAKVARVAKVADIAAVAPVAAVAPTKDCLTAKDLLPAGIGVLIGFMWLGIMIFRQPLGRLQ